MKAHDVFSPWAGESSSERTLYHVATDHIAVFGGDPARRKDKARKRTPPLLYHGDPTCRPPLATLSAQPVGSPEP